MYHIIKTDNKIYFYCSFSVAFPADCEVADEESVSTGVLGT